MVHNEATDITSGFLFVFSAILYCLYCLCSAKPTACDIIFFAPKQAARLLK